MPNPPGRGRVSMRYSKRGNPIGSAMFGAAGLGASTRRGSLAAREALVEAAMAEGSSTVLSDPPAGGSKTVEVFPSLAPTAISSRSPCASLPRFGLSPIPRLPFPAPFPDPITLPQDHRSVGLGKPRKDKHLGQIL